MQRLADEDLMYLVQQGRTDAFEVVFDRHGGSAFALAYRMVSDRLVAEDVVQEAFLSAWRSSVRYQRERGSVRSWLLGIVHHRTVDMLRRHTAQDRRRVAAEEAEGLRETPELTSDHVIRREEASELRSALDDLPKAQSRVIQLAYYGGFTHTEIAEMLDMPIGTVKGRMRLGLEKMRRQLVEGAA